MVDTNTVSPRNLRDFKASAVKRRAVSFSVIGTESSISIMMESEPWISALLIIFGVLPGTNIMERDKRFLAASVSGLVFTSGMFYR